MSGFVRVTLAEHYHFHTFVQVYKILHHLVPAYLQDNIYLSFLKILLDLLEGTIITLFIPRMWTTYGR